MPCSQISTSKFMPKWTEQTKIQEYYDTIEAERYKYSIDSFHEIWFKMISEFLNYQYIVLTL